MVAQSTPLSSFRSSATPHLHIAGETCPTCGQDIPPDKLEEISGRIAARDREQTLAITARLEQKHETEKAEAAAKAAAELEDLRRHSTEREAAAREEARQAAEAAAAERQAQLEQSQREALGAVQQQLADEAAARVSAEQAGASLQTQFQQLIQDHKEELTTLKAAAVAKESEIQEAARRAAQEAAAQQLATAETARQQATEALQTTTAELEATRTTAADQASEAQAQLAELQQAKDAEIAQVKESAAAETLRAREEAAAATAATMRDQLAEKDQAIAAAQTRSAEAEEKLVTLTEQQQATLKQELDTQREILETAKTAEINQIKAKAFEDTQRQVDKLTAELRSLEKKTNDELGEGAEINLIEDLKANFPDDTIEKISKVAGGADIRQIVMLHDKPSGTILYDSKNRGKFLFEHVTKLRADQIADKADHAILSTHKFPKDTRQLHIHEGVVLASPARVVAVATLIRQHLILTHKLRISRAEQESKTAELYEFITSDHCAQYLESVDRYADDLLKLQVKEKQAHDAMWKKEGELLKKIQKAQADLSNEISCIIGTADVEESALEESEL
jgi:hypothetical protein